MFFPQVPKGAKEAGDELQREDPEAMQLEIIHQERKVVDILEKCHALRFINRWLGAKDFFDLP